MKIRYSLGASFGHSYTMHLATRIKLISRQVRNNIGLDAKGVVAAIRKVVGTS